MSETKRTPATLPSPWEWVSWPPDGNGRFLAARQRGPKRIERFGGSEEDVLHGVAEYERSTASLRVSVDPTDEVAA